MRSENADQLTRLSILIRIGQALASNLELGPLLETIHAEVSRLFDTTNFYIALHRVGEPEFEFVLQYEHGQRFPARRRVLGTGLTGRILRTGESIVFASPSEERRFLEDHGVESFGEDSKSWMGVPLVVGEIIVGVMAIQSYDLEGLYSDSDLELFTAIASQLAVAVRNAQLYEDAQRRAREMDAIASTGRDINSTLDLSTVLGRIASSILNLFTHDSVAIFFDEGGDGTFKSAAVAGAILEPLQAFSFQLGRGILGSIAANGKAEIIDDTTKDPRALHIAGTDPAQEGEKILAAPLFAMEQVIGVIVVWRSAGEPSFQAADLEFLAGIGRQASIAIRNAQLFGQAKAALAQAEAANRAKSSFLASMSHELRTPLNAILLYSELLKEEVGDRGLSDMTGDLGKIQGAGRHLLGLIDDILDLSKIEAGRMTIYLEDCDISLILADITATIEPLVAKNHNRLVVDVDPSLKVIHSDMKKVRQVLYNLLSNAAKFTREGTITLSAKRDAENAGWIRFTVNDTGIGMSPELIQRIFQEFSQTEDSIARNYSGTGLGLTLCRMFTRLLGGEIEVSSRLGEGATFTVCLPGLPAVIERQTFPSAPSRGKILIIDDDPSVRDMLSRMLEKAGFQVVAVASGVDGLAMARLLKPQVITLEIAIPGMDGFQLLEAFQKPEDLWRIPVVVLTALDLSERDRERLGKPQVRRIFRKGDYSSEDLVETVRRCASVKPGA